MGNTNIHFKYQNTDMGNTQIQVKYQTPGCVYWCTETKTKQKVCTLMVEYRVHMNVIR